MLNLTGIYTAIGHHASLAQPGLAGSRIRTGATGLSAASERYTGVIFTVLGGASHKRDVFHDFCVFCGSLTWALRFKRIESVEHCCV